VNKLKNVVEICANCGKIRRNSNDDFICPDCECNVCVVVPYQMFKHMVDAGTAKE
jgi:hypothetical protein